MMKLLRREKNKAQRATAAPPVLRFLLPAPAGDVVGGTAGALAGTSAGATALATRPAAGPSSGGRIKIESVASSDPRLVQFKVSVRSQDKKATISHVCTVVAASSDGLTLGYHRDGKAHVYVVPEKLLPAGGRKLVMRSVSKKDKPKPSDAVRCFMDTDFQACRLDTDDGEIDGFVCVSGPLSGCTCNSPMKTTLISSVSFWRKSSSGVYKFHVDSEPLLSHSATPTLIPVEDISRLCSTGGSVNDVTHEQLHRLIFGFGARRPFGSRVASFSGVPSLVSGLLDLAQPAAGSICGALTLTREIVGCPPPPDELGTFVVCKNQTGMPWRECYRCGCHVRLDKGVACGHKFDAHKRCLTRPAAKRKRQAALDAGVPPPAVNLRSGKTRV